MGYCHCTAHAVGLVYLPLLSNDHVGRHTLAVSMDKLLGAIHIIVHAEVANTMDRIDVQRCL